jgi:hypothetical protein
MGQSLLMMNWRMVVGDASLDNIVAENAKSFLSEKNKLMNSRTNSQNSQGNINQMIDISVYERLIEVKEREEM